MKLLSGLIFLLACTTVSIAEMIPPDQKSDNSSFEKRKRKLDSTLKVTDAIIDSLTGNIKYTKADSQRYLYYREQARKEKEQEEKVRFWTKVGMASLLAILAIGFYGNRRGWWTKWRRKKKRP